MLSVPENVERTVGLAVSLAYEIDAMIVILLQRFPLLDRLRRPCPSRLCGSEALTKASVQKHVQVEARKRHSHGQPSLDLINVSTGAACRRALVLEEGRNECLWRTTPPGDEDDE